MGHPCMKCGRSFQKPLKVFHSLAHVSVCTVLGAGARGVGNFFSSEFEGRVESTYKSGGGDESADLFMTLKLIKLKYLAQT